jgi:ribonuclease BN (tRNA processing enzyme)
MSRTVQASTMKLTVVGSGDAFGTGGRFMSAYLIDTDAGSVLLDCGATVTVALAHVGRDPNTIPTIVISHLHGDHFGGLIWIYVQALYASKRTASLDVYGPPGIEQRFIATAELLFPGCTKVERGFVLTFHEIHVGQPAIVGPLHVLAFEVEHPSGAPSYGLRLSRGGRTLAFTGDTRWVHALRPLGEGADLYIMECYEFEKPAYYHIGWVEIAANIDRIGAKRVMLTHMSAAMLARRHEVRDPRVLIAEDGLVLDV